MAGTTTRGGFPFPEGGDAFAVAADIEALAEALDLDVALIDQGVHASRPTSSVGTPGISGRFYYSTDRGILAMDYGTGWVEVFRRAGAGYLNSNGGPLDGGPFQYSAGSNSPTLSQLTPYSSNPAAQVQVAVSGLYPVEFTFSGYAGTYAGPGTQYSAMRVENQVGTAVLGYGVANDITATQFANFVISNTLSAARILALGSAGNWTLKAYGAADGVRTAGWREITLIARERPDLA
jgi:hypothetical protein